MNTLAFGEYDASSAYPDTPPAGTHPATCVLIAELGSHQTEVEDQKTKVKSWRTYTQAYFGFQLAAQPPAGKPPYLIGWALNIAFGPQAKFRKMLEAWRGEQVGNGRGSFKDLLGKPCTLTIRHKKGQSRTFAIIDGVGAPIVGVTVPPPKHALTFFSIKDGPIPAVLDEFPWVYCEAVQKSMPLAEIVRISPEWKGLQPAGGPSGGSDADIANNGGDAENPPW
jgi:hypothetical protein